MSKLIIANWKMAPATEKQALSLFDATVKVAGESQNAAVVICPPFVYLEEISHKLNAVPYTLKPVLGAQDVFWEDPESGGAFTGEISLTMLKNLGVSYVIVGHSERRHVLHESDEAIHQKAALVLRGGIGLILCVGELKEVRDKGIEAAKEYVKSQLESALAGVDAQVAGENLIIAYEPVWAIGTDTPDTPASAVGMTVFIKELLTTHGLHAPVLYGGSVKKGNAESFLKEKEIGGALVGGASLRADEFSAIIRTANNF